MLARLSSVVFGILLKVLLWDGMLILEVCSVRRGFATKRNFFFRFLYYFHAFLLFLSIVISKLSNFVDLVLLYCVRHISEVAMPINIVDRELIYCPLLGTSIC